MVLDGVVYKYSESKSESDYTEGVRERSGS